MHSTELEDVIELIARHWPQPHPWKAEHGFSCFEPMWDGRFASQRTPVDRGSLVEAVRLLAVRFGQAPSLDFAWGALVGRAPQRLPLPLEQVMDEVKDRCDAGELLIALSRTAPRVCRLAAFQEVYEVTIELPDGQREVRPWPDWAAGLEALVSLK